MVIDPRLFSGNRWLYNHKDLQFIHVDDALAVVEKRGQAVCAEVRRKRDGDAACGKHTEEGGHCVRAIGRDEGDMRTRA